MKTTSLKIITPNETIYDGEIKMLTVRTISGYRGILPEHSPLVTFVQTGQMNIHTPENKVIKFNISSGLLIVSQKLVKILTDNISKT